MNPSNPSHQPQHSELKKALQVCKSSLVNVGVFSMFVNLLMLVPTIYMLQIYDRVLVSSSQSTLLWLTVIVMFLFFTLGGLEWTRAQIMNVTSNRLDRMLNTRIYNSLFAQSLAADDRSTDTQPLRDLQTVKQFMTGPGLFAFFDAPWFPFYILVLYLFHPLFGIVGLVSAMILLALAIWNEKTTRVDFEQASQASAAAQKMTLNNLRNAEVIESMGMLPDLRRRWHEQHDSHMELFSRASARSGMISSTSKIFRLSIQSLVLGLGAYLAIEKQISPGLVIAGSILLGRALAPLDQLIAHWRPFLQARESFFRLDKLLSEGPEESKPMQLPELEGRVSVEHCTVIPPGASSAILKDINFELQPGEMLAVVGASASGKSTLARTVLGLYTPSAGSVRFDGAEPAHWERSILGRSIGYLPQDVELLDGTISENIARFNEVNSQKVVKAAKHAGIHDMILQLKKGYDAEISGQGYNLSAGQKQRLGLARALYDDPKIIVLDEPNSNLDSHGDVSLLNTLQYLKEAGSTVIVITHRNNILTKVDRILLLADGEVVSFGQRDKVLAAMVQPIEPRLGTTRKLAGQNT